MERARGDRDGSQPLDTSEREILVAIGDVLASVDCPTRSATHCIAPPAGFPGPCQEKFHRGGGPGEPQVMVFWRAARVHQIVQLPGGGDGVGRDGALDGEETSGAREAFLIVLRKTRSGSWYCDTKSVPGGIHAEAAA